MLHARKQLAVVALCAALPAAAADKTYTDPWTYCAAVRTADEPGTPYVGPMMPQELARAVIDAGVASSERPPEYEKNVYWRCMNGKLWACNVGANIPCSAKADTKREASAEMKDFCREHKREIIPAVVTGHETIYSWTCSAKGTPVITGAPLKIDARGYQKDFWTQIPRGK